MKRLLLLFLATSCSAQDPIQFAPFMRLAPASFPDLTNIANMVLWVDVTQATNTTYAGAPTNGSLIDDIVLDLSPANHVLTANGSTLYYFASGGGYDGTRPYLILTNDNKVGTTEALAATNRFTMGIVWKPIGVGDNGPFWQDGNTALGGPATHVDFNNSGPDNLDNDNAYNVSNGADLESDVNSRSANWQTSFFVCNSTNSELWLNGSQIKTGTAGTSFTINNGPIGYSGWGGASGLGANWCAIEFARGLVWARPLTSNEVYLASARCMTDFGGTPP